jgi:DNA-binding Lrp family transcriptional regulator
MEMTAFDRRLLAAIEDGLPLAPRPYERVAAELGVGEETVIARLAALRESGLISRFGIVVRHHELGYCANAMTVWDVPDNRVADVGRKIAAMPGVTLCYRRPRRLPGWPYNLFCMVHGRDRAAVETTVDHITRDAGLIGLPRAILFSRRRFKQRGAHFALAPERAALPAEV